MTWTEPPLFTEQAHVVIRLELVVRPEGDRYWCVEAVDPHSGVQHAVWTHPCGGRQFRLLEYTEAVAELDSLIARYVSPF